MVICRILFPLSGSKLALCKKILQGKLDYILKAPHIHPEISKVLIGSTINLTEKFLINRNAEERLQFKPDYHPSEKHPFFISGKVITKKCLPPLIPKYIITDTFKNDMTGESDHVYADGAFTVSKNIVENIENVPAITAIEECNFDNF